MRLVLNGEPTAVDDGASVADLVAVVGCGTKGVAVAVNREVVPRSQWGRWALHDDDHVEVLGAAQGG